MAKCRSASCASASSIVIETSSPRRLRVGIAGLGRSGHDIHVRNLLLMPELFEITAVADDLPERRRQAEHDYKVRAERDYQALIKKGGFDIFVNALPSHLHVPASLDALKAGFHVLCEKPMAATVAELDKMIATARKARRILAPFQNNRVQPFFTKLQEILASGIIGEPLHIRSVWGGFARRWDWQTLRRYMGGCLHNTGPHALDQSLALIGFDKEPKVFCRMMCNHYLGGDADDFCAVSMNGPNMPMVEIVITQYRAFFSGYIYEISGKYGGLTASDDSITLKHFDPKKAPRQKFWKKWSVDRKYPHETLPWVEQKIDIKIDSKEPTSGYTLRSFGSGAQFVYKNLHAAITEGVELVIHTGQTRRQIAVIEECRRQNPHIWRGFC